MLLITGNGGCYTGLSTRAEGGSDAAEGADEGADDAGESEGGSDDSSPADPFCDGEALPVALPGLVRLTHVQYDHSVQDLLGLDVQPSAAFLPDPAIGGFDNNAEALSVGDRLGRDYRRAAEDVAGLLVSEPAALADVLPCAPDDGDLACAQEFVADFGRRVFRRPLTEAEQARYVALFQGADGLYETGTPFVQGIRVLVEAFLQSPHFLWRVELSSDDVGDDVVPLGGYEIATRLSYLLWGSTPDDELLDAAEGGELDTAEGIEAQARRLLADGRARATVRDFHAQWLQLDSYEDVQKDGTAFPQWDASIGLAAREETQRFIERVVFDLQGGYDELLTSPSSVVNADLAAIYGLQGEFDEEFVPVELDPAERAGLLTQIGFLASHAFTKQTSPIHRGVFVHRQVLCTPIPDPPGDIDTSLPPFEGEIHTTREAVEAHTSPQQCAGCHSLINEPGFSFEGYDAVGAERLEENGYPVDTTGSIQLDGATFEFDDAVGLAHAISQSEDARRCYLVNWYRYANMRQETADDACTLDGLHESLDEGGYDIQELLVAMTQTTTFRFRRAGEP
jgi:hypothetical protein